MTTLLAPPRIDDDLTRRDLLIGGASLAALLAGCSTAAPTQRPPAASTGFAITIRHKYGSTEIAALRSDLILGLVWGVTDEEHPKLSQIAPTVAQSADFVDGGTPWQNQSRIIGRALGQQQVALDGLAPRLAAALDGNPTTTVVPR